MECQGDEFSASPSGLGSEGRREGMNGVTAIAGQRMGLSARCVSVMSRGDKQAARGWRL